ncbi:MAG TPA: serine/threonine-protein kinase [Polyangiales bacterium]|nr:serine/threonine-protein kinase [Polyangiales bacterium]
MQHAALEIERGLALTCARLFGEASPLLSIGRFRLLRSLGRGGNGCVYEALDPRRQQRVALKVLHSRGARELERDFRALAELKHPNLVALHELHVAPTILYYTMELVEGEDFLGYSTHCRSETLVDALLQLSRGVQALHSAGRLHRDLKPDNVLATPRGDIRLIDLDLSSAGTPGYMSPEQREGHARQSSDWYSVGALLDAVLRARRAAGQPYPSELDLLAAQLKAVRPSLRPTYRQLIAVLGGAGG